MTVTPTPPRQCDIRGCVGVVLWRAVYDGEEVGFCTRHRDLIEEGLIYTDDPE